jgi:FkbM family methyltransferase
VAEETVRDSYGLQDISFRPGDVVIDIGAHVGLVSIYLAKRCPFLRIHAFEPYRPNYENCAENLFLNGVSNVRLHPQAVSGHGGPVVLRSLQRNTGGATALFDMPGAEAAAPVDSRTLDDIFASFLEPEERCRLLKIDCEGMEYEILSQCQALDRVDYLAGEFHEGEQLPSVVFHDGLTGNPAALHKHCARDIAPERMRIVFCRKMV